VGSGGVNAWSAVDESGAPDDVLPISYSSGEPQAYQKRRLSGRAGIRQRPVKREKPRRIVAPSPPKSRRTARSGWSVFSPRSLGALNRVIHAPPLAPTPSSGGRTFQKPVPRLFGGPRGRLCRSCAACCSGPICDNAQLVDGGRPQWRAFEIAHQLHRYASCTRVSVLMLDAHCLQVPTRRWQNNRFVAYTNGEQTRIQLRIRP
jgi:hypothetical protein